MNNTVGISLKKNLQEFINNKNVAISMNLLNLTLTLSINLIYLIRTYNMCKFDSKPIWYFQMNQTTQLPE